MDTSATQSYTPAGACRPWRRFDPITVGMHWATAALVLALFVSAWTLKFATSPDQANLLLTIHRSVGVATWGLAGCRLAWRLSLAYLPPFPHSMSKGQRWAAKTSEYCLYAILLLQPLTGAAQSLARGRPFQLFAWEVPDLMSRDRAMAHWFGDVHEQTAWVLLGMIGLHVLAALFHRFVLKDEVLQSMLPWKPSVRKSMPKIGLPRE